MLVYFRVIGELDTAALEFAFDHLFARHPSMRTRFVKDEVGRGGPGDTAARSLHLAC